MISLTKKQKIMVILGIVLLLVGIGIYVWYSTSSISDTDLDFNETMMKNETEAENEIPKEEVSFIMIHITGSIYQPGLVKIPEGSRISDAIQSAGGITPEADMSKVNLAYPLEDGQKVYIPNYQEEENESENIEPYISSDSGKNVILDTQSSSNTKTASPKSGNSSMVNINTASQTELESLDGVGPSTALKIVEYRRDNGKFNTIEDIKNVRGIGDAKYEGIKNRICVK